MVHFVGNDEKKPIHFVHCEISQKASKYTMYHEGFQAGQGRIIYLTICFLIVYGIKSKIFIFSAATFSKLDVVTSKSLLIDSRR